MTIYELNTSILTLEKGKTAVEVAEFVLSDAEVTSKQKALVEKLENLYQLLKSKDSMALI